MDATLPNDDDLVLRNAACAHADALRQRGGHGDAVAILQALRRRHPGDGKVLHSLALAHRAHGDYEAALACWDEILARQPNNIRVLRNQIEIAERFSRAEDLARFIDEAHARIPDHRPFLLRKAVWHRRNGQPAEAITLLEAAARQDPDDQPLQIELAANLHAARRHDEALAILDRLPGPLGAGATELRINALAAGGRPQDGLTVAEAYLAHTPSDTAIRMRRGQMLNMLGRHRESVAALTALAGEHPKNTGILGHLASALRSLGDHAGCLEVTERLLEQDPLHRGALLNRIEALHGAGNSADLTNMLQDLVRQLNATPSPDKRHLLATALCHGLNRAADPVAREILCQAPRAFAAAAPDLSADQLWGLYQRADRLGLGQDYASVVAALMQAEGIGFRTARAVIRGCFSIGLPNWQAVGMHLLARAKDADQPLIASLLAMLEGNPQRGLALRDRSPGGRSTEHILQNAALLRQAGHMRVAARYMRLVWRYTPAHPALLKEYVACLSGTGQAEQVTHILTRCEADLPEMTPAWREVISQSWAEIDQPARGMRVVDSGPSPATWRDWQIATMMAAADRADLPALAQRLAGNSTHLVPTMSGALLSEALHHADAELAPHETTITAIRYLDRYLTTSLESSRGPPTDIPAIPKTILQYWSQGTPPPQVQAPVQSWRNARGFCHQLLDRAGAQRFLHREWGQDWLRAFNRAGSPTEECDFLRLCHIGLHGGIYVDCDDWLIGDIGNLLGSSPGLTLFREPTGALGNNIIIAPPRHPAILWAAFSARRALLEGHGDNVWNRTGPGLLTRAVVWHIENARRQGRDPETHILPRYALGKTVQFHSPLPYKFGAGYWNRRNRVGSLKAIADFSNRRGDGHSSLRCGAVWGHSRCETDPDTGPDRARPVGRPQ